MNRGRQNISLICISSAVTFFAIAPSLLTLQYLAFIIGLLFLSVPGLFVSHSGVILIFHHITKFKPSPLPTFHVPHITSLPITMPFHFRLFGFLFPESIGEWMAYSVVLVITIVYFYLVAERFIDGYHGTTMFFVWAHQ